ncbi:hypothetical protein EVJ58_g1890 [Rhodofomes roseus]|uniref:Uncharacterized protein n=1 Tax=Rhodofomes roseus TaxID=34475 RepID=A0A4Y9YXP1_9APHY|nr:hypothetical protein EVJ58_g1890 [Rhodofomes roseus]
MRLREYKHDALSLRSRQKALKTSRRLVQSAKLRSRRPFHPEHFERPQENVRMAQRKIVHIGQLNMYDENSPLVSVPETIERPPLPPVMSDMIAKFEPELADTPVEYVREALAAMGTRLMGVSKKCRVDPPRLASGPEVNLIVTDAGLSCLPTHALAVHPPAEPSTWSPSDRANRLNSRGREVIIMPIHAAILVANCGRLPSDMPESRPRPPPNQIIFSGGEMVNGYRIPLVSFCLPMPQAFELLVRYMYTRDKDALLNALVPTQTPFDVSGDRTPLYAADPALRQGVARKQRINRVASECVAYFNGQLSRMYEQARFIEGFWRNAVTVAMSDDGMWETLQLAWEALVQAMKWVRDAYVQIRERETQAQDSNGQPPRPVVPRMALISHLTQRYVQTLLTTGQGNCYPVDPYPLADPLFTMPTSSRVGLGQALPFLSQNML